MSKLLVFLHGKGANCSAHEVLINALAEKLDADVLRFNAPYENAKHPDGFQWFEKINIDGKMQMEVRQFNRSAEYIIEKTEAELKKRGQTWDEVIIAGHSQGGLMACHLGLIMSPDKVVSLCGDFPNYMVYERPIDKDVPIYWIEAGKDNFLSQERKDTYKILQDWGCNLHYFISPESSHNRLEADIVSLID